MSRAAHRLFSSPLRLSTRLAHRSPRAVLTRRAMSSESHGGSTSNDTPWMIGSALVFGPLFLYLVSPSARKDHHGTDHEHNSHRDVHEDKHAQHVEPPRQEDVVPIADDEGTKVSAQEVKESIEKAVEADSPKDAQEEVVVKETTNEDSSTETRPEAEDATIESEPDATPITPVEDDVATQATGEENAPSAGVAVLEPAAESKA